MEEDKEGDADEIVKKANDLVRLALFTEQRRVPLRRDDISKKVLGAKSRSFGDIYSRAQDILRKTFGMELVELRARAETEDSSLLKEKEAMNIKKKAAPAGTKSFILRSVLDPSLIQMATTRDGELQEVEQAERLVASDDEVEPDNTIGTHSTGSIFAWHHSDQLGSVGILYVILALILVNGRSISDNQLRATLHTLRLVPTARVPTSNQSTHQDLTTDNYLNQLVRQNYIERYRVGEAKGGAKKRGRAPAATQGDEGANAVEWRWGPRAMSEVGESGIAKFVAEFMVRGEDGEDDEGNATQEEKARQRVEKMLQGIEKAAGGKLLDITGK